MESKKFWQSKTLWVNAIALLASVLNGAMDGVAVGAEETAAALVIINVIMRAVTRGAVTL